MSKTFTCPNRNRLIHNTINDRQNLYISYFSIPLNRPIIFIPKFFPEESSISIKVFSFFCAKRNKNWLKSNKQTKTNKKSYRFDKYRENQQNAARKWTEKKKKRSTYMNKCPYEWRLTYNIQNRDRTKNIHTHRYQEII